MKNYTLHIPEGVKDFLWDEAKMKSIIADRIKALFCSHGYHMIETPTFEYLDVWTLGDTTMQDPGLYKWINRQGEIVALRSDMTKSIARVVATQNSMRPLPQRYTYVSNVFRYPERYQGKQHEFTQAGIELIGHNGCGSDAEIIMLAIEALKEAGVEDFTIHIGSATFLREMLKELGATKDEEASIYRAIDLKDAVTLKHILSQLDGTGEVVEALVHLMQRSGGIELVKEIKGKLTSDTAHKALEDLESLYVRLKDFDVEKYILFDFSMLSYASYYTGVMFQGFTEGVGAAIVEGGRYDGLVSQFGKDIPAVGMAMHINWILQKLQFNKVALKKVPTTLLMWDKEMGKVAIGIGKSYREEGLVIEYSLTNQLEETLQYAREQEIGGVMYFRKDGYVEVYDITEGNRSVVQLAELGGEV